MANTLGTLQNNTQDIKDILCFGVFEAKVRKVFSSRITPPPILFNKIKYLFKQSKEYLRYFLAPKSNQKVLGCSPIGQTLQRHKAAAYLQATYAPDKSRTKQIFASRFIVCLFRLSRNPKPEKIVSSLSEYLMSCLERGTSEIRHLPIFLKIRRSLIRGFQPLRDDRCVMLKGGWNG